ncbi:MAG: hypothetical protein PUD93_02885 [Lachnospiraceae bacterium]|nr:hypothetical protein [Lachnospiraceae bacterium]
MKQDDIAILREIQKNTKMAMAAIDTLLDKVEDDKFIINLSRQSVGYARIHNDAVERLIEEKSRTCRENQVSEMILRGSVHANTLFNTSLSHLAEMLIQGSNRGLTSMYKSVKHHTSADERSVELAKELMDFEEKNIEQLKDFL